MNEDFIYCTKCKGASSSFGVFLSINTQWRIIVPFLSSSSSSLLIYLLTEVVTTSSYCVANKFKVARAAKHLIAVCDILVRRNSALIIKTPSAVDDDNNINNIYDCVWE